ncbi:metallophosphoesterase [Candidatus Leptofilum sp.]|uniref:metallophosphoesterase n=1 Tax=Candidatus Leptofilum sp. TaxID=3241576 RepID=UPI003B59D0B5
MKVTRRGFLKWVGGTAFGGLAGAGYVTQVEPEWLQVEQQAIRLPNLPAGMDGYKIVQLSDFHLYPFSTLKLMQKTVALTNELAPDLVLLTGDYVLETAASIFDLAPELAKLNPRHGAFAVLGNHDHWTDPAVVKQGLAEQGIELLHNKGVLLNESQLFLAGVDDLWSGEPDFEAALADQKADVPTILLAHEPDFADDFLADGRIHLQLSGHTHGGQVRVPGLGPIVLPRYGQKYHNGLYQVGQGQLYVNRGIGVIGPAVRLNCPPEITEIVLRAA